MFRGFAGFSSTGYGDFEPEALVFGDFSHRPEDRIHGLLTRFRLQALEAAGEMGRFPLWGVGGLVGPASGVARADHNLEPERMPVSHRLDVLLRTVCLAGVAFAPMAAVAQDAAAPQTASVAPPPAALPAAPPPAASPAAAPAAAPHVPLPAIPNA